MTEKKRMKKQIPPSFNEEKLLWAQGISHVVGIDEVGRGAFAGPLVAAGVIFNPCLCSSLEQCERCVQKELNEIHDSKLLTPTKREELSLYIQKTAFAWSIAEVSISVINRIGIGKATQIAFKKVVSSISYKVLCINQERSKQKIHNTRSFFLIDGFPIEKMKGDSQKAIIKGDQISISIAAASIIAKVYRDKRMKEYPEKYAMYHFDKHKGYGTKEHQEAIRKYGLSDIHRKSFHLSKFTTSL